MRQYATSYDYAQFTDVTPPPPDADAVLRRASSVIDGLLVTAVYDVDDDGMPTGTAEVEALRDATCAQAAWFYQSGDVTGADTQWASMSLGSASLARASARGTGVNATTARVAPEAVQILRSAGLLNHGVRSW